MDTSGPNVNHSIEAICYSSLNWVRVGGRACYTSSRHSKLRLTNEFRSRQHRGIQVQYSYRYSYRVAIPYKYSTQYLFETIDSSISAIAILKYIHTCTTSTTVSITCSLCRILLILVLYLYCTSIYTYVYTCAGLREYGILVLSINWSIYSIALCSPYLQIILSGLSVFLGTVNSVPLELRKWRSPRELHGHSLPRFSIHFLLRMGVPVLWVVEQRPIGSQHFTVSNYPMYCKMLGIDSCAILVGKIYVKAW